MTKTIISKEDAKEQGLKKFYDGKPCKKGHDSEKYVRKGNCVECKRLADKADYQNNKERRSEYGKNYYKENKEYVSQRNRKWRENNKEEISIKRKEEYWADPEKARQEKKDYRKRNPDSWNNWYEKNKEHRDAWKAEYESKNRDEILAKQRAYNSSEERKAVKRKNKKERYANDPLYRMEFVIRGILRRTLGKSGNKKSGKTYDLLGYTSDQLKDHVESLFLPNMGWENVELWHLDHLIPISRYLSQGIEDVSVINSLNNLAPMWAEHNLDKRDKTLSEWLLEKGVDSEEYSLYNKYLDTPIDKAS